MIGSSNDSAIQRDLEKLKLAVRKRKSFALAIGAWAIMALTVGFLWIPQVRQTIDDLAAKQAKSSEYETIKQSVEALSRLDRAELTASLPITETALPFEKPVLPLLYSIDRLAREAQVTVSNFQVSPGSLSTQSANRADVKKESTLVKGVLELPLTMDVSGSFENMNAFFKLLDNIVPIMHVSGIEFTAAQGTLSASQSAQFQATVNLNTLYSDSLPPAGDLGIDALRLSPAQQDLLSQLKVAYDIRLQDELLGNRAVPATGSATRNLFQSP